MTPIPYSVILDIKGNNVKVEPIKATINDVKSIRLNIKILVGTTPFDLTECTAKITYTKPDNLKVFDDLIIDDFDSGLCHVVISNQAYAAKGEVKAEIEIFDALGGRISSPTFSFLVRKGELDDETIVSTNSYTALETALAEVTDFIIYRSELQNARQGFNNLLANQQNKDARLDHLGFDFKQQGGVADGVTDNRVLLQSLMDTLNTMGGGNIYVPDGTYFVSQDGTNEWAIKSKSNVNVNGAGVGKTIFKLASSGSTAAYSLFWYKPSDMLTGDFFENFSYRNFSVDGYSMNFPVYSHKGKAFYMQKCRNGIFENLDLRGLPSTALGTDFLHNVHIKAVHCTDCGRLWEEAWTNGDTRPAELGPGGAGIGIGTGLLEDENFTISDCITDGCGHYGIFLEHQALFNPELFFQPAKGVTITNCVTKNGRFAGIGVRGGDNIAISNHQSFGNKHGFYFDAKAGHSSLIKWNNITISDSSFTDNTAMGGYVGGNVDAETFKIDDCNFSYNGAEGLVLGRDGDNHTQKGVSVTNCDMKSNTLQGIYIDSGTYFRTLKVMGNTVSYNGADGLKDSNSQIAGGRYLNNYFINNTGNGIKLIGGKTHLQIKGNYARDDQGTKTQMYGLYHGGGGVLAYSTIEGNDFRRNGTKGMYIPDSVIDSTSYVRWNKTDENGLLDMPANSYVAFPSELSNFAGATSITLRVQFRLVAGIAGGVEVYHMVASHGEDEVANPKGWNLHVKNTGLLVFEVRSSTGGTLINRVSTTALVADTTYDMILTIDGTNTTMTINGVAEVFSTSTGTNADLLTAMQNCNTSFPVYLKGKYYGATLKTAGALRVGAFVITKVIGGTTTLSTYNFDNYGANREVIDIDEGLNGSCYKRVVQIDHFL